MTRDLRTVLLLTVYVTPLEPPGPYIFRPGLNRIVSKAVNFTTELPLVGHCLSHSSMDRFENFYFSS